MISELNPVGHGGKPARLQSAASDTTVKQRTSEKTDVSGSASNKLTRELLFKSIQQNTSLLLKAKLTEAEEKQLKNLLQVLKPLSITDPKKLTNEIMFKIRNSGVFFNRNVVDLISRLAESGADKLQLFVLLNSLSDNTLSPDLYAVLNRVLQLLKNKKFDQKHLIQKANDLKKECKSLIKFLENQQKKVFNYDSQKDNTVMCVLPWNESDRPLFIRTGLKSGGKKENNSILFDMMVSLFNIGEVRVELRLIKNRYFLKFYVQSDAVKDFLQTNINFLMASLKIQMKEINCIIVKDTEKIADYFAADEDIPFLQHVDIKV